MNRFFTLLLAASCLTAVGQVTYPYNPDGNADGDITVGDLQDFLGTYGNPFSPSDILVDGVEVQDLVQQLSDSITNLQLTQYGGVVIFNSGIGGSYNFGSPYEIPVDVGAVIGLAGTYLSSGQNAKELRLPSVGIGDGHIIDVVARGNSGVRYVQFRVMAWENETWNEVGFIQSGFYGGNCGLWCGSRRFIFQNGGWTTEPSVPQVGW